MELRHLAVSLLFSPQKGLCCMEQGLMIFVAGAIVWGIWYLIAERKTPKTGQNDAQTAKEHAEHPSNTKRAKTARKISLSILAILGIMAIILIIVGITRNN